MNSHEEFSNKINEISKNPLHTPIEIINNMCTYSHSILGGTLILVNYLNKGKLVLKAGHNIHKLNKILSKSLIDNMFCLNVINTKKSFFSNKINKIFPYSNNLLIKTFKIKTYLCIPLFSSTGELSGTLCFLDKNIYCFSDNEIKMLTDLSKHISIQLEQDFLKKGIQKKDKSDFNKPVKYCIDINKNSDLYKKIQNHILSLSEALENSHDGVIIMDTDGKIIFINNSAKKMFSLSSRQISGTYIDKLIKSKNGSDITNIINHINKYIFWEGELNVRKKRGETFTIWITAFLIKNYNYSKIIAIISDITEWKNMENELKSYAKKVEKSLKTMEEKKLISEAVISSMADGMFTVDDKWIITSFNPAAEKITRVNKESAIGKSCSNIFHGELCKHNCALSKSKESGKIILNIETKIRNANKEWIPVIISTAPLKNHNGEIIGGIETFRDISQMEKINQELKKLNTVKTDFLSMVSHELKTPLTIVKGYTELLLHERIGKLAPGQKDVMETIKNKIDKLNYLINDLLDISQIEFGKFRVNKTRFNLTEVLINKANEFKIITEKKDLQLTMDQTQEQVFIYGDKDRIGQVISNLLSNSIKFTNPGGKITLSIKTNSGISYISVADTGIGLSNEQKNKIFDKFYQVDTSNTRKYDGVGLGLAICKDIIEMHDGNIKVQSKLNQGSTFTIAIPYLDIENIQ